MTADTAPPTGSFVDRLRRPEYTGENRCWPCTAVNLGIAGGATAVAGVAWLPAAPVVLAGSLAAIYLRGYLVPGTPELTKRYLPDRVLAWFDKAPEPHPAVSVLDLDVEAVLRESGAVTEDATGDLAPTPAFAAAVRERVAALGEGDDDRLGLPELAALLGPRADPDLLRLRWVDGSPSAWHDHDWLAQWESRAAYLTDLATATVLAERYPPWNDLSLAAKSTVLSGYRLCLTTCPVCEGAVELGTEVVASCCREYDVVAATCDGCGARLFEVAAPDDLAVDDLGADDIAAA